jgi:hypothetical protein
MGRAERGSYRSVNCVVLLLATAENVSWIDRMPRNDADEPYEATKLVKW